MELVVKHYSELTADELYDILHVRVLVFVVEQKCPYEEVDGRDRQAYHVFLRDETGIKAYLRVLDRGVSFEEVSIGRVLTTERRRGYGHKILDAASPRRGKSTARRPSASRRRPTPGSSMRITASGRTARNFWRTISPTSR